VGEGLREVGFEFEFVMALDDAGKAAARALADGCGPFTGEVLVASTGARWRRRRSPQPIPVGVVSRQR
jgi:hypothetical protein